MGIIELLYKRGLQFNLFRVDEAYMEEFFKAMMAISRKYQDEKRKNGPKEQVSEDLCEN